MEKQNQVITGILFSVAGFALFSTGDAAVKLLSRHDYSVFQITWVFAVIGMIVLLAASPWLGGLRRTIQTSEWKLHLTRAVLSLGNGLLSFYGFSMLQMDKVYTLFFCAPFFTSILAIPLLNEKIGWHRWLAIGIGFTGVMVALRPGVIPLESASIGIIAGAFLFALINLLVRRMNSAETLMSFALYPIALRVVALAPLSLPFLAVPSPGDFALFFIGGASGVFGFICMATAFRLAPASVASPFHYTQMIWGILFGLLLFGDHPDAWTLAGATIIIASGLYLIYRENRIKNVR